MERGERWQVSFPARWRSLRARGRDRASVRARPRQCRRAIVAADVLAENAATTARQIESDGGYAIGLAWTSPGRPRSKRWWTPPSPSSIEWTS